MLPYYHPSPLLAAALAALEQEARSSPDAARLWAIIGETHPYLCCGWFMLEELNHFDGCVRSRPALMAVLLKELSAAFPVPLSLLH
jgi:hypothetical protein